MDSERRTIIRTFAVELIIYGILVVLYFFLVLRTLGTWLHDLYANNLTLYAVAALVIIVAQGLILEAVSSFLVDRLGLERRE